MTSAKALLDGKFFTVVSEYISDNKYQRKIRKIKAKCSLCTKPSFITCSTDSTSNFLRHIKLKHGKPMYEAYLAYKKSKSFSPHQDFAHTGMVPELIPTTSVVEIPGQDKVQKLIDRFQTKLLKFMIDCMMPLSLTDTPSFRDLFPDVLNPTVTSIAVGSKIEEAYGTVKEKIKSILNDVKYFCITVDMWTVRSHSFIGITVHWLTDDLMKHSAILSCSRIVDVNFENVVNHMNEVFSEYYLNKDQMVAMLTDNGYNYVKVLRDLKVQYMESRHVRDVYKLTCSDYTVGEVDEQTEVFDFEFLEIEVDVVLHPILANMKNVCYILNSVATLDYKSMLDEYEVIAKIHETAMMKCNNLWISCSKLSVKERICQIVEGSLPHPCVTSWKSLYDALKGIVAAKNKLPQVCDELKIEEFMPEELEYLETFITVMHPIVAAIETLRNENVYFGCVLPTLLTIKIKLEEMSKGEDTVSPVIAEYVLQSFSARFDRYLKLDTSEIFVRQAILAAVSHPRLKMRWISDASKIEEIQQIFVEECSALCTESESKIEDIEDDDFFAICLKSNEGGSPTKEIKSSLELEVLRFLESKDKSMEVLNSYSNVKLVFMKYNALLTSLEPVEKLFSFETLLHCGTTANNVELEIYMFLKGNMNSVNIFN